MSANTTNTINTTNTANATIAPSGSAAAANPSPSLKVNASSDRVPQCAYVRVAFSGSYPPFEMYAVPRSLSADARWELNIGRTPVRQLAQPHASSGVLSYSPQELGQSWLRITDQRGASATSAPLTVIGGNCSTGPSRGVLAAAIAGSVCGALVIVAMLYLGYNRYQKRKAEARLAAGHRRAAADLRAALAAQADHPAEVRPDEAGRRSEEDEVAPPYEGQGDDMPPLYKVDSGSEDEGPPCALYPPRQASAG